MCFGVRENVCVHDCVRMHACVLVHDQKRKLVFACAQERAFMFLFCVRVVHMHARTAVHA